MHWWAPRDQAAASRLLGALCLLGVVISVGLGIVDPDALGPGGSGAVEATVAQVVVLTCGALLLLRGERLPGGSVLVVSVLLVALTSAANLVTRDESFTAQMLVLVLPVLAALLLRPWGFVVVGVAALLADGVLLGLLSGPAGFGRDWLPFAAVVAGLGTYLARAGAREERRARELNCQADRDPLTGLTTRRVLEAGVETHLGAGCALLLADLDHFKRINDTGGHAAGDQALRSVAAILDACARGTDVPARLGGDEFALLLPDVGAEQAVAVGERLRREVAALGLTLSVGCAVSRPGDSVPSLVRRADEAMYAAKAAGRDRVVGPLVDRVGVRTGRS